MREKTRAGQLEKIFIYTLITWVVGSNLIYFTESHLNHPTWGPYAGYWQSYWNTVIILFSGIEDKAPLSLAGRIEVTVLLIAGICFAGVITGEIVSILVRHMQRSGKITLKPPDSKLERHIIIIGQNKHLHNVIKQVNAALKGRHYILVVCRNADELKAAEPLIYKKVMALQGDALDSRVLDKANLNDALRVVLLSSNFRAGDSTQDIDNRTLMKTLAVVGKNHNIPIVAELQSESNLHSASTLDGVEFVVSRLFGERLASQAVLNPGVTEVYDSLMTFTDDSSEFYTIPVPKDLIGKTFKDAQIFFLDLDEEAIVLAGIDRSPPNRPTTLFKLSPYSKKSGIMTADLRLHERDRLIVIAYEQPTFSDVDINDLWRSNILSWEQTT